jgi:pimeloyl-ACP methyl ester carboxylesterase
MAIRPLRTLGTAVGVAATLAGAAYTAERVAASRLRRHDDEDLAADLVPPFDEIRALPGYDESSISVISRGEGPPIVLSHGVMLSVRTWVKQMESLAAAGFRTIAFDHRGHGASTVGLDGHTLDALAHDVRTVVEGLDLRDAVLVGHSMGGVAIQLFCLRHPEIAKERVAGIVLLSTLSRTALSGSPRLLRILDRLASAGPDATGILGFSNLGLLIARIGFGRHPQPSHVELTRQMILACTTETRRTAAGPLFSLELSDELPRIAVPTLVLCGTNDVLTPPAESRRIASLIPGARLEMLEGAGHMAMLEQAERVDELIVDFAREVQAEARAERPEQPRRAV